MSTETRMVSPNEMFEEAKKQMLNGHEPKSIRDWEAVMNFFAANVIPEVAEECCRLMALLFDMPLSAEEVDAIVAFQLEHRGANDQT